MKRPVVILLLAVILGECIAITGYVDVINNNTIVVGIVILLMLYVGLCIYRCQQSQCTTAKLKKSKITTKQIIWFGVVVLFFLTGFYNTTYQKEKCLCLYELQDKSVEVEGKCLRMQKTANGYNVLIIGADVDCQNNNINNCKIIFQCKQIPDFLPGDYVKITGKSKRLGRAFNIGNFDEKNYYKSQGIYLTITDDEECAYNSYRNNRSLIRNYIYMLRRKVSDSIDTMCQKDGFRWSVSEEKTGIFKAMIIGDKSELDERTKEMYRVGGISHVLTISGLHISMVGIFLYTVARRRFKFVCSGVISIITVFIFVIMTGEGVAGVRAAGMFFFYLLCQMVGRKYDIVNATAFIAMIMMVDNPFILLNSGFLMSYGAIVAVGILVPVLEGFTGISAKKYCTDEIKGQEHINKRLKMVGLNILNMAGTCIMGSTAIQIVLAPVIAWNYFEIPFYAVFINILVIPLLSLIVGPVLWATGLICMFDTVGFGLAFIPKLLPVISCLTLDYYEQLCRLFDYFPGSTILMGRPSWIKIAVYYGVFLIVLLLMKKKKFPKSQIEGKSGVKIKQTVQRLVTVLCLYGGMLLLLWFPEKRGLSIIVNSVGQGECIVIKNYDVVIMVDCGSSDVKKIMKNRVQSALKAQKINRIDYLFVSHADNDHISGMMDMLIDSDCDVYIDNIVLAKNIPKDDAYYKIIEAVKKTSTNVIFMDVNQQFYCRGLQIECLAPKDDINIKDRNDASMVLSVSYGKFSMLFTGDISFEPEQFIEDKIKKRYTVLKVPHHGSAQSSSERFINKLKPKIGIISCGINNSYGHPHKELIQRLEKANTAIFRTDEDGQIILHANKNGDVKIKCACSD
ncbi:MAG: DNA internalization-related competence protein ComEC/Rec2 [Lachnospiraceae bacterium]|nr:DNA internalization-related competence protein ComEC/Rec2 [Lachnospiraceae bacterium]